MFGFRSRKNVIFGGRSKKSNISSNNSRKKVKNVSWVSTPSSHKEDSDTKEADLR